MSKVPAAKPEALFCEPLKAAGKEFSGSGSRSEVTIGFLSPIPDSDCDPDADSDADL